jgi:hypothetical protein
LQTTLGAACSSSSVGNAVKVTFTKTANFYFAGIFGAKSKTLSATATATPGSAPTPYNVAIIADTTASMSDTDSGDCNTTRLACEKSGIQILLQNLSPCVSGNSTCISTTNPDTQCAAGAGSCSGVNVATQCAAGAASCSTATTTVLASGNVTSPVTPSDNVSLFVFPNVTSATASADWASSGNPTIEPYTFPTAGATSYSLPSTTIGSGKTATVVYPTYQVLGYSSDYRTSDNAATLNSSSWYVRAAGGASGYSGLQAPGGEGTYYAGAIYAAQSSLVAEYLSNYQNYPHGIKNVIILISDGDASAKSSAMPNASATAGVYPSLVQQCHQAITAAQFAARPTTVGSVTVPGTIVYSVSYGAASSGCSTDTSPTITPCDTMRQIASAPQYFYSDYAATGADSSCTSTAQPTSSLKQIFTAISSNLSGGARLVPNSTT